jgi:hypothetical protein
MLLFSSGATLLCCALPMLLVSLGLGAAAAALFSAMPFLTLLGLYKSWTFGITATILAVAAWFLFRPGRSCPPESAAAEACAAARVWNIRIFWFSVALWGIGFFAAFLWLPIMRWLSL